LTRGYVSVRRPRHPIIRNAQNWGEAEILKDLQAGVLLAHVPAEERGTFRMIPSDFWRDRYAGVCAGGTLYAVPNGARVPEELVGSTIFIFEDKAYDWLLKRKINEENPDYPRNVRKGRPLKIWKLPPNPEIKTKMKSLMDGEGYSKNDASRRIGHLRGFKAVTNTLARSAIEECNLKPGRRPKKP
jgi:hypothetical protein